MYMHTTTCVTMHAVPVPEKNVHIILLWCACACTCTCMYLSLVARLRCWFSSEWASTQQTENSPQDSPSGCWQPWPSTFPGDTRRRSLLWMADWSNWVTIGRRERERIMQVYRLSKYIILLRGIWRNNYTTTPLLLKPRPVNMPCMGQSRPFYLNHAHITAANGPKPVEKSLEEDFLVL